MTTLLAPLDFYARIGAALFPLPADSKTPGPASFWNVDGAAGSFKKHCSTDPAQWAAWSAALQCNFGLVAFASRLIVIDIDTKAGRDEAWAMWCSLTGEWGLSTVPMPHVASPSGGWHVLFSIPPELDASTLRQPDAIKSHINVRCIGYVVAAGSNFEGRPYTLLSDAPPYPAPAALIEHCTRRPAPARASTTPPGSLDPAATAQLLTWLTEHGQFEAYEDWVAVGMALKLEFGDAGFPLWELTFDPSVTPDTAAAKWDSFATEPDAHSVTILTFLSRAHKAGWKGSIGRSTTAMFGDVVAQLATSTGASLASAPTGLVGNHQTVVATLGQQWLDEFFDTTKDAALSPSTANCPQIPDAGRDHPLFDDMNTAIQRIVAMAENPKTFRAQRALRVLAVLNQQHPQTYQAVVARIQGLGARISATDADRSNKWFETEVAKEIRGESAVAFVTDSKGKPDPQVSDNVTAFLRRKDVTLRKDVFADRVEIADADGTYKRFDQAALNRLWYEAKGVDFQFHPSKDLFKTGVDVLAEQNRYDSLTDRVDALATKWDRTPRLDTWLARAVGVPADALHRAIGRNLIGGMVSRARHPGCMQAETVIFISPKQGTGKSSLCRILALDPEWYTDSFELGGTQQNSLPLLAGKWIIELSELSGMNKTDVEAIKKFLTTTTDKYIKKYEAIETVQERRCVFIGTTNARQPLTDTSGNRRFLPVYVPGEIDLEWLRANVEQIIGEAAVREAAGESFAIPREIWDLTAAVQEAARSMSPVEEAIHDWFDRDGSFYITKEDLRNALRMAGYGAGTRGVAVFMEKLDWRDTQANNRARTRVWMKHRNNKIDECVQLIPAQQTANGRVEMRVRQGVVSACPVPPVPFR